MPKDKDVKLYLSYSGKSDVGMIRSENQDSFGKFPEDDLDLYSVKGQLFVVADGVGGHTGGKEASSIAVKTIGENYNSANSLKPAVFLKKAVEDANSKILKKASETLELMRMATTCTAMLLKEKTGTIAHVGDSRVYMVTGSSIKLLTNDHTQVQEMLNKGILSDEEADNFPSKSVLIRAVGVEEKIQVDIIENIPLEENQAFVLCSDGLAKVSKEEILKIVISNSTEDSCDQLINLANDRGGKDNVTVLVVKVDSNKDDTTIPVSQPAKKSSKSIVLIIAFIILLLLIGFAFKDSIPFLSLEKGEKDSTNISNPTVVNKENLNNESKVNEKENSPNNDLIKSADLQFQKGKMERALNLYKSILVTEPMHLQALNGINNIAEFYFQKAERFRKANNISSALVYYYKVNQLQPDNKKNNYYISLYKNQIQRGNADSTK